MAGIGMGGTVRKSLTISSAVDWRKCRDGGSGEEIGEGEIWRGGDGEEGTVIATGGGGGGEVGEEEIVSV